MHPSAAAAARLLRPAALFGLAAACLGQASKAQHPAFCPPTLLELPQPCPDLGPANILGAPVAEVGQLQLWPQVEGGHYVALSIRLQSRTDWDVATGRWGGPGSPVELNGDAQVLQTPQPEFGLSLSPDLLHAVYDGPQGAMYACRRAPSDAFGPPSPIGGLPPQPGLAPSLAVVDSRLQLYVAEPFGGAIELLDLDFFGPPGQWQMQAFAPRLALLPPPGFQSLGAPTPIIDRFGNCRHLVMAGVRQDGAHAACYAAAPYLGQAGLEVSEIFGDPTLRLGQPAVLNGDIWFPVQNQGQFVDPLKFGMFAVSSGIVGPDGGAASAHAVLPAGRQLFGGAMAFGFPTPPAGLPFIDHGDLCIAPWATLPMPGFEGEMLLPPLPLPAGLPVGLGLDAQLVGVELSSSNGPLVLAANHCRFRVEQPSIPCQVDALELSGPVPEQNYQRLVSSRWLPIELPPSLGQVLEVRFGAPIHSSEPFVAGRDFFSTRCPDPAGNVTTRLHFCRAGTYVVQLRTLTGLIDYVCCINGAPAEGGAQQAEARYENVDAPSVDLVSVENKRAGDNNFVEGAADAFWGEERHGDVTDLNGDVDRAYRANGSRPLTMFLAGHGSPGSISVGNGQGGGANQLRDADIGVAGTATQAFIDANRGKLSELTLFGCNVGRGAAGERFLQRLADALSTANQKVTVHAYDRTVCASQGVANLWGDLYVIEGGNRVSRRGR